MCHGPEIDNAQTDRLTTCNYSNITKTSTTRTQRRLVMGLTDKQTPTTEKTYTVLGHDGPHPGMTDHIGHTGCAISQIRTSGRYRIKTGYHCGGILVYVWWWRNIFFVWWQRNLQTRKRKLFESEEAAFGAREEVIYRYYL